MTHATYDLIVIGSGPAGEKGAAQAAYFGRTVALVEAAPRYGGTVANTGVPGKAMRETALYLSGFRQRSLHGLTLTYDGTLTVDRFLYRGRAVRRALDERVAANLARHRVDVRRGRARFVDAHTIEVPTATGPERLEAGVILIATGSTPCRPPSIPAGTPGVYDSDSILQLERLPRSITIAGGGAVGCEYACLFKVLGLDAVRLVHAGERILPFADAEIGGMLREALEALGVELHVPDAVEAFEPGTPATVRLRSGTRFETETLLLALGRRGSVDGLGLEHAGVRVDEDGHLPVNEHFQTNVPHIYAAGDVIGGHALSSTAMEEARVAMVHAFDLAYKPRVGRWLPIGVWTIPEVSMVGETEQALRANGVPHVVGRCRYDANPRGLLIGERRGLLKLVFSVPDERLLGVHAIGEDACELVAPGLVAMTLGATCATFIDTCFNYPSLADMYKYAAYDAMDRIRRGEVFHGVATTRSV